MSILIKGMEMPFCCLVCPCSGTDITDAGNEVWVCEASKLRQLTIEDKIERRPEWCPLVPVPPHGRLIDAEKIYDAVEQRYRISSGIEHRCERDLLDLICAAPTIIPAEEDE